MEVPDGPGDGEYPEPNYAELVARLRADPNGPLWALVQVVFAPIGIGSLHRSFLTGTVNEKLSALRRPVSLSPVELRHLQDHPDDRTDLVHEAVRIGLGLFRDVAVLGPEATRWQPSRGADPMTYFVNGCFLALPNLVRAWRTARSAAPPMAGYDLDHAESIGEIDDRHSHRDIAELLADAEDLDALIACMHPELGRAARLYLDTGDTWAACALRIGISPRALEGHLYRFRKNYRRRPEDRS